jgi:serine/threonine-protein kinase RsbW
MYGRFCARFPSTKQAAGFARRYLMRRIAAYRFAPQEFADIESAIGEALANATEHGYRPDSEFQVGLFVDGNRLVIEVEDEGAGFALPADTAHAPNTDLPRGFGIFIMRHLMDEVEFGRRGTLVRLKKRLPLARADYGVESC